MKNLILTISTLILLSSCAPKPVVVEVNDYKDRYLDCNQLDSAIRSAERFKIAAKANGGFKPQYIFPPTGILAMYRLNSANSAANDRIKHLNRLIDQKECNSLPKQRVINPQILDYPNKNKHSNNESYNYYRYDGEPQYSPMNPQQQYIPFNPQQYRTAQDYYNQYLNR